jgi:hypothetical protein
MQQLGKALLFMGLLVALAGLLLLLAGRVNLPLGRLPGDLTYHRKNLTVFAPFGTMIVVSVVITLVMNIISRWMH